MRRRHRRFGLFLLLANLATGMCPVARALNPQTSLARYSRQSWSTDTGLPQNSAHAILQTSNGFLWIATEGGLARFDGYQFRIFDTESTPRLPGNDIRSLVEDPNGALWVGTGAGVTLLMQEQAQTYTVADGLPADAVRSMLQTKDGSLWVVTTAGIAVGPPAKDGGRVRFHTFGRSEGMTSDASTGVIEDGGGVWVGTATGLNHIVGGRVEPGPKGTTGTAITTLDIGLPGGGGNAKTLLLATPDAVLRMSGGSVAIVASQSQIPPGGVRQLIDAPEGVWIAAKGGVILLHDGTAQRFAMGKDLPGSQVYTIARDRQGAVWIGTNTGLARWSKGTIQTIQGGGETAFAGVLSLYDDREGNLWTGTETGGIGVLRDPLFEVLGRRQGLADETVTSLLQTADTSLWVGTNGGGVNRLDPQQDASQVFTSKNNALASDTVLSLAAVEGSAAHPSELWVGTPDGLNVLRDGRWRLLSSADGLADDLVRSLLADRDGSLWIGTRRGLTRWKDERATIWTTANGLGSDLVGAMVQDTAGDLWIGTLGGLSRMQDGSLHNFTVADGLPSNTITALEAEANGSLWIGTREQGLAVRNGGHFFSFARAIRLPRTVYAILQDGLGSIWLSSDRGIYRVRLDALEAFRTGRTGEVPAVLYGTGDGLPSLEGSGTGHPSAWRLADGRLCFASRRGVVVFDPASVAGRSLPPRVVLEQITINGRTVDASALASVAPGASNFTFSFAGISLAAPQRVQYQYRLEGFDRDWIDAGARRTAFYTNLASGHYRFQVRARVADGIWGEQVATTALWLRPHIYQTILFRLAMALLAALLMFGIYRLRLKSLQSRFDAVSAERNRIAREIHDTLAQGFVAVSVRLEIMSQLLRKPSVEACREQLDRTREMVRDSLAEARRSIWDLRTEGTDSMTLPARLARIMQQKLIGGMEGRFETTGTYRSLESSIEDELFRIAQEAIANAVRHARAHTIEVRLRYTAELLVLEIADDGSGFDVDKAPSGKQGHFGLIGMKERAHKVGATVILESDQGLVVGTKRGTTVKVEKRL